MAETLAKRPHGIGRIIGAGVVGGIIVDLFLIIAHIDPFPGMYMFIASGLVGKVAFTSSGYIALGILLHLLISIVWAAIYVVVFQRLFPKLPWWGNAVIFGIVVMLGMNALLLGKGLEPAFPSGMGLVTNLVAHIVFFALPVAYVLRNDL